MTIEEQIADLDKRANVLLDEGKVDEAETLISQIEGKRKLQAINRAAADAEAAEKSRVEHEAALAERRKAELEHLDALAERRVVQIPPANPNAGNGGGGVVDILGDERYDVRSDRSFHVRRYGTPSGAMEQLTRELYGAVIGITDTGETEKDYLGFVADKHAKLERYVRFGPSAVTREDMQSLVLSPGQLRYAATCGLSVSEIRRDMASSDDAEGGFNVPEDFRMGVIERLPEISVFRQYATVERTSRDIKNFLRVTGGDSRYPSGVRAYYVSETGGGLSATSPTWGNKPIPIHKLMAETRVTRDDLDDSSVNVLDVLERHMAYAIAIKEQEKYLIGTGTGEPEGILKNATTGGPNDDDINTFVTGAASGWSIANLRKLRLQIDRQYRTRGNPFVAIMNSDTLGDLLGMTGTDGHPIVKEVTDPERQSFSAQMPGVAIEESEVLPDSTGSNYGTVGGDLRGYAIVDRMGMSVRMLDDRQLAKEDSVEYLAKMRHGGGVIEPWRLVAVKTGTS